MRSVPGRRMIGAGNVDAAVGADVIGQLQLMDRPFKGFAAAGGIPVEQVVPDPDFTDHKIGRLRCLHIAVNDGLLRLVVHGKVHGAVAHVLRSHRPFFGRVPFFEKKSAKSHDKPPDRMKNKEKRETGSGKKPAAQRGMDLAADFRTPEIAFMLRAVHIPGGDVAAGFLQAQIQRLHLVPQRTLSASPCRSRKGG